MDQQKNTNYTTSRDYELLIQRLISQEMSGLNGVELIEIKHNHKMVGQSGYEHQIDVSYRFRIWKIELLVLVECKQYKGKVGVDELLEFRSRLDDLRAHKGLFVTTNGFQSGAFEYAKANGIALLVAKGTQHRDILYQLRMVPPLERCERQIESLVQTYESKNCNILSRLTIDKSKMVVLVKYKDTKFELQPGELCHSMLYEQECDFADREGNSFYFDTEEEKYIEPNKILKSMLVREALLAEG